MYLLNNSNIKLQSFSFSMMGILTMICIFYSSIFIDVGIVVKTRIETINNAVSNGEKSITLYKLPYEDYYWITVPPDKHWESYYKEFYNIPQDVELYFE